MQRRWPTCPGITPRWAGCHLHAYRITILSTTHPRVSGENAMLLIAMIVGTGSSPRGRGKPSNPLGSLTPGRLIPARAGKTTFRPAHAPREPAHPRAGGETGSFPVATDASSAHPRAGGENAASSTPIGTLRGSSPRGRGKLDRLGRHALHLGLIPAWAGKTSCITVGSPEPEAHPRMGGENLPRVAWATVGAGSSPRGRGKLHHAEAPIQQIRLIPARAGKTDFRRLRRSRGAAHPRAGGENPVRLAALDRGSGSSPRGRGKRPGVEGDDGLARLIPARAGKT